jgi:uncharacterized protein YndB with AHSA1/START domain
MLSAGQPTCFLIADISGYTSYLAGVELDHAQDIVADLVGTVVSALRPTFRLAKLEGDAAFTYAPADKVDGSLLLDTIERCYFGFRRRRRDVRQATSCECNACVRIPDLNLKFVVHHGQALHQKMAGRDELMGSDVIIAHRLLKNDVVQTTAATAYALITQASIDAVAVDPVVLGMTGITETYEHIGEIRAWVHDLERRWQEEDQRQRVLVSSAAAAYTSSISTAAPPQLAWAFVTEPGRRLGWQTGTTEILVSNAQGGRRAVGTTNHCMHGKDAVVEEILDWRPYDYLTERTTMNTPMGPAKFVTTVEFEPTSTGTVVHFRFAPPKTAKERAIMREMAPLMDALLEQHGSQLAAQLDAELEVGRAGGAEPTLPTPRPDGVLASAL